MKKTLNDYAVELAIVNADLCTTFSPTGLDSFGIEDLRDSICNRIINNRLIDEKDSFILAGFVLNLSYDKIITYKKALINYAQVLDCESK